MAKAKEKNKLIVLGSGTSCGVPIIGCHCPVCLSPKKKNKRLRTSILIQTHQGKTILIDTSPDVRSQLLKHKIEKLDAAIITHEHADHTHGIDDLRPFCFFYKKTIPIYTHQATQNHLTETFPYIFQSDKIYGENRPVLGGGIPRLELHPVQINQDNNIEGENFRFFLLPHGYTQTLAFIHGKLGYIVDCHHIPDSVLHEFREAKLDLLIIDCLRATPHQTHLTLDQTMDYIDRIKASRSGTIHMGHEFEHDELRALFHKKYGSQVFPLWDNLALTYSAF